jgi:hypothetical protein
MILKQLLTYAGFFGLVVLTISLALALLKVLAHLFLILVGVAMTVILWTLYSNKKHGYRKAFTRYW